MFFLLGVVLCVVLQIFNNVRALFFREYVKNWNLFKTGVGPHAQTLPSCHAFAHL